MCSLLRLFSPAVCLRESREMELLSSFEITPETGWCLSQDT